MTDAQRFQATIRSGGIVLFPADTVYGLACAVEDRAAVARLFALKRRAPERAAAVMWFDRERALEDLPELGEHGRAAFEELLPGPVTLLIENPRLRFGAACAGDPRTLGVRVPKIPALAQVCDPVLQSSANLTGGADARRLGDVAREIRGGADLLLDGGELPGTPSTVIDLRGFERLGTWSVVREGAVGAAAVACALEAIRTG